MAASLRKFPRMRIKNYQDVRGDLRSGDLLLCSGQAVFSKVIQKATGSDWSHVGFLYWLPSIDRLMVMESVESVGVRTVPLSKYFSDYGNDSKPYTGKLLIARHEGFDSATPAALQRLGQFAAEYFSYPYDGDEIARISARILKGTLGFTNNVVKRDKEFICSEYVWECYKAVGIKIPYDRRGFIAPKDFAVDKNVEPIARLA